MKPHMIKNPPFPRNYADTFLQLEEGKGVRLTDKGGKSYLDFGSGIAVNALGYGNKLLADTAQQQMMKLIHVSNLYTTGPAVELAEKLCSLTGGEAVHFGNSGSEANETALKYSRAYALRKKGPGHHKYLSFKNSFHGRTMGALSVTFTEKYRKPYEPMVQDVVFCEFNNAEELENIIDDSFAAVICEPLQGEGGLNLMDRAFAEKMNELCRKHDVLIIADEIQSGLYRAGTLLASEAVGLKPDIICLSKPLAAGLPLSATIIPSKVNELIHLGDHGTTFGGGPVTTAVALKVIEQLESPAFQTQLKKTIVLFDKMLEQMVDDYVCVRQSKGLGMLRGLEIICPEGSEAETMSAIITSAREQGLLILRSGSNIIRLAPPLIISGEEMEEGLAILAGILNTH